jgi:hypothetical protein
MSADKAFAHLIPFPSQNQPIASKTPVIMHESPLSREVAGDSRMIMGGDKRALRGAWTECDAGHYAPAVSERLNGEPGEIDH